MRKYILKVLRRLYLVINPDSSAFGRNWKMFSSKEYANELIYQKLIDDKPCMIARFGSTEMLCITNNLGVKNKELYKKLCELHKIPIATLVVGNFHNSADSAMVWILSWQH